MRHAQAYGRIQYYRVVIQPTGNASSALSCLSKCVNIRLTGQKRQYPPYSVIVFRNSIIPKMRTFAICNRPHFSLLGLLFCYSPFFYTKKGAAHGATSLPLPQQRPTFPGGCPPSIIGTAELNYCVRYGYRCVLCVIVTELPNTIILSKYLLQSIPSC